MTEMEYTEMLEYAFKDEGEAIEFYQDFLDTMPKSRDFDYVRRALEIILDDEKRHLAILAQLIDEEDV